MSTSDNTQPQSRNRFFLYNIGIGALVAIISIYMVITGEYGSLAERRETESFLNIIFMAGVLYSVGAWFIHIIKSPHINPDHSKEFLGATEDT